MCVKVHKVVCTWLCRFDFTSGISFNCSPLYRLNQGLPFESSLL